MGFPLKKIEQLSRLIQYVIARHPGEFGLVTDANGFVPLSELLKVLHEEGWHHIRRTDLESLSYHLGRPLLEIASHLVRATDRSQLDGLRTTSQYPKLLYAPIRRRAYDSVLAHGLRPQGHTGQVVLFRDQNLAHKVGQRRDSEPIIVTVNTQGAHQHGCRFRQYGEGLFLTTPLPSECCRLPRPPRKPGRKEPERATPPPGPHTPRS